MRTRKIRLLLLPFVAPMLSAGSSIAWVAKNEVLIMSVSIAISVEQGLTLALQQLIEQYPEAVGAALMRIAERVLDTSNVLVPVRTGFLKSSLDTSRTAIFKLLSR